MNRVLWVAVIAVLLAAGCRKKKETKVYYGNEEEEVAYQEASHNQDKSCDSCHDWNLVQLHDSSSPDYNGDCIKCHGDKQNPETETTLDEGYASIHVNMCEYVFDAAGQETMNNAVCTYCHTSVDFLDQSAAGLRRQVPPDECVKCHTSAGPGRELYQD